MKASPYTIRLVIISVLIAISAVIIFHLRISPLITAIEMNKTFKKESSLRKGEPQMLSNENSQALDSVKTLISPAVHEELLLACISKAEEKCDFSILNYATSTFVYREGSLSTLSEVEMLVHSDDLHMLLRDFDDLNTGLFVYSIEIKQQETLYKNGGNELHIKIYFVSVSQL